MATIRLSTAEQRTLARWYLAGIYALRTTTFWAPCATFRSLTRKGLIDATRLTDRGRQIGKALADAGVI